MSAQGNAAAAAQTTTAVTGAETENDFQRLLGTDDLRVLRRIAVKLAGGAVDPDDLLQDALERACRGFERFEPGSNLHAWLRTIMQRLVIDEWRKRGRRRQVTPDDLSTVPPEYEEPAPAWSRYDVDEVRRAVVRLSEPLQTTFRLYSLGGMSYAAIGGRLGIPMATVGTRLRRARQRLRKLLEAAGPRAAEVIDIRSASPNPQQFQEVREGRA
jgi:RNA polymerase sigma-70 factor (ECF subfamily)